MTAGPKVAESRAGFLRSVLVGVSAASVVVARPVVESAEAAAEPLVETCERRRRRMLVLLPLVVPDHVLLTCLTAGCADVTISNCAIRRAQQPSF